MSENNVGAPLGFIQGTAEVRDKHGNLKGSFTFGGPATVEQAAELQKLKLSGDDNGSNTDHSGP